MTVLVACHSARDRVRRPIGVFDSGVGGLSVWQKIRHLLPDENTLYFADQAQVPYGPRSLSQICEFSLGITDFLLRHGCKVIVVACNTASAAALQVLRETYPDVPFVGMEPAVKPAAERTTRGVIGVLATPTTFRGSLFQNLVGRFGPEVVIHRQVCPGLVEAIERGDVASPRTRDLLSSCLCPLLEQGIDQLVLGCTHYPFVRPLIEEILGPGIEIHDPSPAVARQVRRILRERDIVGPVTTSSQHLFYTTGAPEELSRLVDLLVGWPARVQKACWRGSSVQESKAAIG